MDYDRIEDRAYADGVRDVVGWHKGEVAKLARAIEAAMFVSCLQAAPGKDYTLEEKEWFARCPCGEDHVGE